MQDAADPGAPTAAETDATGDEDALVLEERADVGEELDADDAAVLDIEDEDNPKAFDEREDDAGLKLELSVDDEAGPLLLIELLDADGEAEGLEEAEGATAFTGASPEEV